MTKNIFSIDTKLQLKYSSNSSKSSDLAKEIERQLGSPPYIVERHGSGSGKAPPTVCLKGFRTVKDELTGSQYYETYLSEDFFELYVPKYNDIDLHNAAQSLNVLSEIIHQRNIDAGWWTDIKTGQDLHGKDEHGRDRRNVPEMLMLIVSEVSEAMEGYRKNLMDDKLPNQKMFDTEMCDVLIRCFDLLGSQNIDVASILMEKVEYNKNRPDHKKENRLKEGGKLF